MKIVKAEQLRYKTGYAMRSLETNELENLSLGEQVYCSFDGVNYPIKIVQCFEGAKKFGVEVI